MRRKDIAAALMGVGVAAIAAAVLLWSHHSRRFLVAHAAVSPQPPAPTLDMAAYNAKMLSLANLPPCSPSGRAKSGAERPTTRRVAAKFTTKKAKAPACPPPLWPPHSVYPDAGALLPFKRIVAYYGNFYSPRMGVLGEYPPDKVLAMLEAAAAAWTKADPSTPVVPAIDYIAVAAQDVPGRDGKYRMRMPAGQIEKAIRLANQIHGLVFLDVQPGWSTVEMEVPRLGTYLQQANVELALDPEFALYSGKRPGAWRGTMNATDINFAAQFLAKIARENHLPPKILVIHRFTERMVTDYRAIQPLPDVEVVMDMDGFGSRVLKVSTYKDFIADQPVQFTGFKLFYKNDVKLGGRLMTPEEILRLSPRPSYILYQ
jgi:hypothetical protein